MQHSVIFQTTPQSPTYIPIMLMELVLIHYIICIQTLLTFVSLLWSLIVGYIYAIYLNPLSVSDSYCPFGVIDTE